MRIDADEALQCRDCDEPFVVTVGERAFYLARTGVPHLPRVCRPCRIARRAMRSATAPVTTTSTMQEDR